MNPELIQNISRGGNLKIIIADYFTNQEICKMSVDLKYLYSIPAIIGWELKDIFFLVSYVPEHIKFRPVREWVERRVGEDFFILILVGNS